MGRFTAGNNADPDRLQRVMNAKQRLIGVRLDTGRHNIARIKQPYQCNACTWQAVGWGSCCLLWGFLQVDFQALAAQVEAKRRTKEQEKAEEQ